MIIIVSHNGKEFLDKLIPTINDDYLIVDNGSDTTDHLEGLNWIEGDGGWCIGGYIKGFQKTNDDEYFFMHDSMVIKNPDFLDKFRKHDVCGWLSFPMFFDNPSQEAYIRAMYNLADKGCFGPIFYAKREALEKISWDRPETSDQAHGMERGITCAFKDAGYDMKFIDELDESKLLNGYEDFSKCLPKRA